MTSNTIDKRIGRLEDAAGIGEKPHYVVVLTAESSEADETVAIERYRAEHPDVPEYAQFIVFVTGFTIASRDPLP